MIKPKSQHKIFKNTTNFYLNHITSPPADLKVDKKSVFSLLSTTSDPKPKTNTEVKTPCGEELGESIETSKKEIEC